MLSRKGAARHEARDEALEKEVAVLAPAPPTPPPKSKAKARRRRRRRRRLRCRRRVNRELNAARRTWSLTSN
jgi:hypothetical protein